MSQWFWFPDTFGQSFSLNRLNEFIYICHIILKFYERLRSQINFCISGKGPRLRFRIPVTWAIRRP